MIKRLQRKFVVIAAVCLLIVEFAIIGGINGVNIYQTNKNADDLLNIIIENDGRFPEFDPKGMKHDSRRTIQAVHQTAMFSLKTESLISTEALTRKLSIRQGILLYTPTAMAK